VIKRFRARLRNRAGYSFYVWENGGYVQVEGGEPAVGEGTAAPDLMSEPLSLQRPASLDQPRLEVVRKDGVQILTLEVPGETGQSVAA
jgi:hypothetical protein